MDNLNKARSEEPKHRRFGVADGLILIAGVAAGLASCRVVAPEITPQYVWEALLRPELGWSFSYAFEFVEQFGVFLAIPLLAAWTPACLFVQVRKPRARWRRLRRQPGFLACLITVAVVVSAAGIASSTKWLSGWVPAAFSNGLEAVCVLGSMFAGAGVLWSWVTMAMCGVYRPLPTWCERLGRLTGSAWIAAGTIAGVHLFRVLG